MNLKCIHSNGIFVKGKEYEILGYSYLNSGANKIEIVKLRTIWFFIDTLIESNFHLKNYFEFTDEDYLTLKLKFELVPYS